MFCLSLKLNYKDFFCQMGLVRVSLVVSLLLCWVGPAVLGRPGRRGRGRSLSGAALRGAGRGAGRRGRQQSEEGSGGLGVVPDYTDTGLAVAARSDLQVRSTTT